MACLAKIKETREWLADWMSHHNPRYALKVVERAAVEQRANLIERAIPHLRKRVEASE